MNDTVTPLKGQNLHVIQFITHPVVPLTAACQTTVVLNSPKLMWMMTSKLSDQPCGTDVFRNHGYPDRCMGQTLIKVSMVSKNHR